MRKKMKILSLLLSLVLPLQLCGCAVQKAQAANLMEGIVPNKTQPAPISADASAAAADFAVRLFRASFEREKNTLISPLSVLCALSMTANGAENGTLTQMESTLGMRRELYNEFFKSWLAALSEDKLCLLQSANSVWIKDSQDFSVKKEFLQINADSYGADVFKAPFDEATLSDVNNWVERQTDGMIPHILDQIPDDVVMYLINALAFDAKWQTPYPESGLQTGQFTCADGVQKTLDFMHSTERIYLKDARASGFLKYYEGGKYAFAALLPKQGVGLEEYLDSLTGESLQALLTGAESASVHASLPKFEVEYDAELSKALRAMGMELPFDRKNADFSGITGSDDLFISRVLHKTYISVAEQGTRAGAATAVEIMVKSAMPATKPKEVILDRPFVYLLVDLETNVPLFIGTMLDPAEK